MLHQKMQNKSVLVTGSTGFIGSQLCAQLSRQGADVLRLSRSSYEALCDGKTDDISLRMLRGVRTVFHLAARVHVIKDKIDDPLKFYRKINGAGSVVLAREAERCGVKRFVFVSTVGVYGPRGPGLISERTPVNPKTPYAISKYEAEQELINLANNTRMAVFIVRPPMVYGPTEKGNMFRLLRLIEKNMPLPLALGHNQRSFVSVQNVAAFLAACASFEIKKHSTFVISDLDISVRDFAYKLGSSIGKKVHMFPVSSRMALAAAKIVGKYEMAHSLFGSLILDTSKAREEFGWVAPFDVDSCFEKIGNWYLDRA